MSNMQLIARGVSSVIVFSVFAYASPIAHAGDRHVRQHHQTDGAWFRGFFGEQAKPAKQKRRKTKVRKHRPRAAVTKSQTAVEDAAEIIAHGARTIQGYADKIAQDTIDAMDCAGKRITEGDGLTTVRTLSAKCFTVARRYAAQFAGFVHELERSGYKIELIGGYARRYIDPRFTGGRRMLSQHARGMAIDINQTGRNHVTRRFPSNVTAMAARWGLTHGAVWSSPDTGHFEISAHTRYATKRLKRVAGLR